MKRYIKTLKAFLIILTIMFANMSTYAAIGANDGSAFVTKAEFDALVNTFNEQMDNYENGVVSKIDGAIANYLASLSQANTSEAVFFNGEGNVAMVMNMDNIKDFKIGKPGYDMQFENIYAGYAQYPTTKMTVTMKRNPDDANRAEFYMLNPATKQLMIGSNEIELNFTKNTTGYMMTTWLDYNDPGNDVRFRWHADIYGGPATRQNSPSASADKYYSNRFSEAHWAFFPCSGINWSSVRGWKSNDVNWTYEDKTVGGAVKIIFDSGKAENKKFVEFKDDPKEMLKQWREEVDDGSADKDIYEYFDTTATYQYDTPDRAGFTTGVVGDGVFNRDQSGQHSRQFTNCSWTTVGAWDSKTSPANSCRKFIELVFTLNKYYSKNVVNVAINDDLLDVYNKTRKTDGWFGTLTQGIPVDMFDELTTASFELDTRKLGGATSTNVVIAFKTTPFLDTEKIDAIARDPKITSIKVDGVSTDKGFVSMKPDEHTIEFTIDTKNPTPVYIKLGYPSSVTTSIRNIVVLPKTYMKTTY